MLLSFICAISAIAPAALEIPFPAPLILENGQRYGVGIHTNGSLSGNSATRFNTAVYNNVLGWKNAGL